MVTSPPPHSRKNKSRKKKNPFFTSKGDYDIIRKNDKKLKGLTGLNTDTKLTEAEKKELAELKLYAYSDEITFDPETKKYIYNIATNNHHNALLITKKIEMAGLLYEFQNLDELENIKKSEKGKEAFEKTYNKRDLKRIFKVDVIDSFESPYTNRLLDKFHDVARVSDAYNKAIEADQDFTMGTEYPKLILDTNKTYPNSIMESYDLNKIRNNFVYFSLKNALERMDKLVGLRDVMTSFRYQFRTYGRGCILKKFDETTGLPLSMVTLPSKRLGHIFVDKLTFKILGVEYYDLPSKDNTNILTSDEIIYHAHRDYGQTENCYGFGYADPELIINYAETNVIINAVDLKEINKAEWMPFYIISIVGDDPEEIARVQRLMNIGKRVLTKNKVEVATIDNKHDGNFMLDERDSNDKKIVSSMGTMGMAVDEKIEDNHSTAMVKAQIYNQTKVKRSQLILRDVFESQWYNDILRRLIRFRLELYDKKSEIRKKYEDSIKQMNRNYKREITSVPALRFTDTSGGNLVDEVQAINNDRQTWRDWQERYVDWKLSEVEKKLLDNNIIGDQAKNQIYDKIKEQLEVLLSKITNTNPEETDNDIDQEKRDLLEIASLFDDSVKEKLKQDDDKKTKKSNTKSESEPQIEGEDEPRELIWIKNNFPSPSDINFEITILEKLITMHPRNYDFKVKMNLTTPSLVTELERSAYVRDFISDDIIPKNYGRKIMGWNDLIEDEKQEQGIEFEIQKTLRDLDLSLLAEKEARNLEFEEKIKQFDPMGQETAKESFKQMKKEKMMTERRGRPLDNIANKKQSIGQRTKLNSSSAS